MTDRRMRLAVLWLILATPVCGWSKDDDRAERRHKLDREIQQLDRELDRLRRDERAARNAKERCDKQIPTLRKQVGQGKQAVASLLKEADGLQSRVDAAASEARTKSVELQTAQRKALDAAPSSSPVARARQRYETARKQYEARVRAIEDSDAYRRAYQAAKDADDRAVQLPAVRAEFITKNPEVTALQAVLAAAKSEFDTLGDAYFDTQPECARLARECRNARGKAEELKQQRTALAGRQNRAAADLRDNQKELSAAEAVLRQAEKQLGVLPERIRRLDRELSQRRAERRRLH